MTRVVVENSPSLVDYFVAGGTIGAAVFAGCAAFMAKRSTDATNTLVAVETDRDKRTADETFSHQARRISVDLISQTITLADGRGAHDVCMTVQNASGDPVFKCRLKIIVGDATWGPVLVGTIPPGDRLVVMARLITDADPQNTNGYARCVDVNGQAWAVKARGPLAPDHGSTDDWIAEGNEFASQTLTPEQRGTVIGTRDLLPDFDAWRADVAGNEIWDPGSS